MFTETFAIIIYTFTICLCRLLPCLLRMLLVVYFNIPGDCYQIFAYKWWYCIFIPICMYGNDNDIKDELLNYEYTTSILSFSLF
jgi:hypothetical protein